MPLSKRPARIETECELLVSLVWLGRLIGGGAVAGGKPENGQSRESERAKFY